MLMLFLSCCSDSLRVYPAADFPLPVAPRARQARHHAGCVGGVDDLARAHVAQPVAHLDRNVEGVRVVPHRQDGLHRGGEPRPDLRRRHGERRVLREGLVGVERDLREAVEPVAEVVGAASEEPRARGLRDRRLVEVGVLGAVVVAGEEDDALGRAVGERLAREAGEGIGARAAQVGAGVRERRAHQVLAAGILAVVAVRGARAIAGPDVLAVEIVGGDHHVVFVAREVAEAEGAAHAGLLAVGMRGGAAAEVASRPR